MMKRHSLGAKRNSSERMKVLMPTDLPDPVVPAISKCGIRARSAMTGAPPMSLPSTSGSFAPLRA